MVLSAHCCQTQKKLVCNFCTWMCKSNHKPLGNMASKKHFLPVVAKGSGPTPGFEWLGLFPHWIYNSQDRVAKSKKNRQQLDRLKYGNLLSLLFVSDCLSNVSFFYRKISFAFSAKKFLEKVHIFKFELSDIFRFLQLMYYEKVFTQYKLFD